MPRGLLKEGFEQVESTKVTVGRKKLHSSLAGVIVVLVILIVGTRGGGRGFTAPDPCDPSSLGEGYGSIAAIYQVEDGQITDLCFGASDNDLFTAWTSLANITTPIERASIKAFAVYDGQYAGYTQQIDGAGSEFMIAIERSTAQAHPQSLRFVVAHELAHVFTNHQSNPWSGERVPTLDCLGDENLYGCAGWNNYLATWTYQFWPDREIEALDGAYREPSEAARRCAIDAGFVGEYAATNPGEDFADSFAAYILSVPVHSSAQSRVNFMSSYVDIVAMRDRIHASGLSAPDLVIDRCGR